MLRLRLGLGFANGQGKSRLLTLILDSSGFALGFPVDLPIAGIAYQ